MSTPITRRTVLAGTGAAALLSATGVSLADEHEDDEDNDLNEDDPAFAAVNTVHASPDAPEVDVYVNGARVLEGVAFRDISDYLVLLEGEYQVQVVPVEDNGVGEDDEDDNGFGDDDDEDDNGFGDDDDEDDNGFGEDDEDDDVGISDDANGVDVDEEAVIDEQIDVPAGVATAAVVGEVDEGAEQELELLVLDVDLDDLEDGESRVRAVHASPDAPEVDIVADDDPLVEGLSFGDFGAVDVEEGDYTLEVREAGEDESVADFDVTLEAGVIYSAFAVGFLEEENGETEDNGVGMDDEDNDDDNGVGDDDNGVGTDDDNGVGDNDENNGVGNDVDTGFDLLLTVDALTPESEVEEMPEDEEDDNGIGDDDEDDDNGIGDDDEDDDNGIGDDDDNGIGDDDEDDDGI